MNPVERIRAAARAKNLDLFIILCGVVGIQTANIIIKAQIMRIIRIDGTFVHTNSVDSAF